MIAVINLFSLNNFIQQLQLLKFYLTAGKKHRMNSPLEALLQNVDHAGENVLRAFSNMPKSVTVLQRHFRRQFRKEQYM